MASVKSQNYFLWCHVLEIAAQVLSIPCLVPTQVEHEEFQQESVLKQLEVLQEEDKEYQHIKVWQQRESQNERKTQRERERELEKENL